MNNQLILGRYIPLNSLIHELDPRTKLIGIFAFILIVFLANSWPAYLLLLISLFLAVKLSQIDLKFFLQGIRPMVWLILFTVIFQVLFTQGGTTYFSWGIFSISSLGLINGAYIFMRLLLIIMSSTVLTLTTAPLEIADGLEHLMRPLAKIGFPAHEIALMLSIALRYVPTLMDEAQKIMNAQRARGVEFDQGTLIDRVRAIVPILVPLFVSAFNRAEEMAVAMEARGYRGAEGRTKYRQLFFTRIDLYFVAYLIVLTIILVILRWFL
ncbi:energy-coupling factor transporter transmembrane component T family protein [Hutsoniella sourekii]